MSRSAAVKKSQCATGGGVGDEPLNEMEESIVGLLNVESVEGIPGSFDIGVAPIQEVFVGVPFSLPLSGTSVRPSSAKPVPSVGAPARPSSARPVPSLDSQEASTSGQPEVGDMLAHSLGNPKSRQEKGDKGQTQISNSSYVIWIKEDPTQKIIEGQQAITARFYRLVELHEQMHALKAYKLNVFFQNGEIVPKYE
ncbi:uncharacterized protein LOC120846398 [Ixodes scapularis]|uniref:uncharacterized protein LOC120846398 n=1 Tax=Ixodes scapularis TaxID=6945 RepID=UPI001A9DBCBA|nr:uncharacterized protein LOC120846398 [Ixodes scapularis]